MGVNLPADRVIIRSPQIGIRNLGTRKCQQMVGRAGRTGNGPGDAYLILDDSDISVNELTGRKQRFTATKILFNSCYSK